METFPSPVIGTGPMGPTETPMYSAMWTPSLSVARMQSPIVRHKLAHSGGLVPVIADTTNEGEVMHVWDVVEETVGACVRFVTRRFWLSQTTWG